MSIGKQGERIAANYLKKNGYRVLYRNFRSKRGGEIDLVCRDCQATALVFVEVKTRTTDAFGPPHYAVTVKQQDRIIRGAKEWLRMLNDPRISYRFDVVEVLIKPVPVVNLIRGAFQVTDDIYLGAFVRNVDYLIVGQGLAGSMVACLLEMQGKNVLVIDNAHQTSASLAAAGIMNPITGKRLNRPHLIDQLLQIAFDTYPRVERFLGGPIFQRRSVLRILKSEDESKQWKLRLASGEYAKYLGSTTVTDADYVENRHGGFEVAQAGLLDVPGFVRRTRDRLFSAKKLIESNFEYDDFRPSKDHVRWGNYTVNAVIFCEGYQMMHNPFFNSIALNPAKGEVLTLRADRFVDKRIIQHEKWLLRTLTGEIKAGTTYTWDRLDENPSPGARDEIERSLRSFARFDFEVTHQSAGVRPVIKADNRPIVGVHPLKTRIAVLNGLGSKGVLQAPFAARQLIAYLEAGEPIHPDFDVCRKSLWE